MKNIEIEKRFYIDDKKSLFGKLNKIAKKLYSNHQIDSYYVPKHRNFLQEQHPFEWLRLREEDDKYSFTYKHWHPERVKESTHCDEYETIIEDGESFKRILDALDFKKVVVVDKLRVSYSYKHSEISVDDVKDLGIFIEIEIKSNYESVEEAFIKIYDIAKELGLTELAEDHPVRTGYPLPLYKKKISKKLP